MERDIRERERDREPSRERWREGVSPAGRADARWPGAGRCGCDGEGERIVIWKLPISDIYIYIFKLLLYDYII
jgi:hypothetical protein